MNIQTSTDGTKRILNPDGYITVLIPSKDDKWCVCVSCQLGCPIGCKFCWTGKLKRNLTAEEIVAQFTLAKEILGKTPTSVVFMGMGEPMMNFKAVEPAIYELNKQFSLPFKRITLSTSGFYLDKLLDVPYHVALSLHTPFDSVREKLMPQRHTVAELLDFTREYSKRKKFGLMIQYALMKGVNDRDEDLAEILRLDWPKNIFFNLIEYNNKGEFTRSERLLEFKEAIRDAGYKCFIRHSRGSDIDAACGMLEISKSSE